MKNVQIGLCCLPLIIVIGAAFSDFPELIQGAEIRSNILAVSDLSLAGFASAVRYLINQLPTQLSYGKLTHHKILSCLYQNIFT